MPGLNPSIRKIQSRLVIESSQSGGRHVIYRCDQPVDGNLKLAQGNRDGKQVTLIETRGEGGLFLCSPSAGYEIIQGDLVRSAFADCGANANRCYSRPGT